MKTKLKTKEVLIKEFLVNYTPMQLATQLADCIYIMNETPKKISITQEQLDAYFKISGIKSDGTEEKRGRKKKTE